MLFTKCECETELVFDDDLVRHVHQCPVCKRSLELVDTNAPPPKDAAPPPLLTTTCGCRRTILIEESRHEQFVRCPACDRLLSTFYDFGTQRHWITREVATQETVRRSAQPLPFRYARSGIPAIVFGLTMLVTTLSAWSIRGNDGRVASVPVSNIFTHAFDSGTAAGDLSYALDLDRFIVVAWAAGVVAVLAGLLLRGRLRAGVIAAGSAVSAVFLLRYVARLADEVGWLAPQVIAPLLLILLIPLLVLASLRLRIGPRPFIARLRSGFAVILLLITLVALVAIGQERAWSSGAWELTKDAWSYLTEARVLLGLLLLIIGVLPLVQLMRPKFNTLEMTLTLVVLLILASGGGGLYYVVVGPRQMVESRVGTLMGAIGKKPKAAPPPKPVDGEAQPEVQVAVEPKPEPQTITILSDEGLSTAAVFDEGTIFALDAKPAAAADLLPGTLVSYEVSEGEVLTRVQAYTFGAETALAVNLIVLMGGTMVLLTMALTDFVAATLATPDDWRKP